MANFFDQFDAPAPKRGANFFDQFDAPPEPPPATARERAQAAASGVNRGVLVNTLGLPVKTVLDVVDLGKAAVGTAKRAFGADVEAMPELIDRAKVPGSPEWLAGKIEAAGGGRMVAPDRPDDPASRYLHAGGQGVAAGMIAPQNAPQALASAAMGAGGAVAGEGAAQAGADPATQILAASVLPAATAAAAMRARAQVAGAPARDARAAQVGPLARELQDAGYVFPPAQTNPSALNKTLSGISGKAATEQEASLRNQPLTNQLARTAVGETGPLLTPEGLAQIRKDAAKDYDAVKSAPQPFAITPDYVRTLVDLNNRYVQRLGGGGGQAPMESLRLPQVERLLQDAARPEFSPTSAVELMKRLRRDADDHFRNGNSEQAHYEKGLANALEDVIGDNLAQQGQPDLLAKFRDARARIAKAHTVEDALNASTGDVDARKLHAALQRGAPLTDELLTAARAGGFAPLSARPFNQTPPGPTALDTGIAVAGLATGIHPGFMAGVMLPHARAAARNLVLSQPYQRLLARAPTGYRPSVLTRALAELDARQQAGLVPYAPAALTLANQ
jgi:hypothetical protein